VKIEMSDDLARQINSKLKAQLLEEQERKAMEKFAKQYGSKMKAPSGMKLESIADETARLGMKAPNMRNVALKEFIKKFGSPAARAVGKGLGGAAGLLMTESLDSEDFIENPDIPLHLRGPYSKMASEEMADEMQTDEYMDKLKNERLMRAAELMKKYGKKE
jgi:hypothetical protein